MEIKKLCLFSLTNRKRLHLLIHIMVMFEQKQISKFCFYRIMTLLTIQKATYGTRLVKN